jgi:hypothetical protein
MGHPPCATQGITLSGLQQSGPAHTCVLLIHTYTPLSNPSGAPIVSPPLV